MEKEFEKMGRINRSWQINWDTSRSVLGLDWVWRLGGVKRFETAITKVIRFDILDGVS